MAAPELDPDIMKRRCPRLRDLANPIQYYGTSLTGRKRQQPYALKARLLKCPASATLLFHVIACTSVR